LTRPGHLGPVPDPSPPTDLGPILAGLSGEICRPLESLRSGIHRLLGDSNRPISAAERVQAQTMLDLCDDLSRLTRECLESQGTESSSGTRLDTEADDGSLAGLAPE